MGLSTFGMGVIAPYRAQVQAVKTELKNYQSDFGEIEVNTVDQYQGRDKLVIICTFTKSRDKSAGGSEEQAEKVCRKSKANYSTYY